MSPRAPKLGWCIYRVFRVKIGGLMLISLGLFEEETVLTRKTEKWRNKIQTLCLNIWAHVAVSKCQTSLVSGAGIQGLWS